MSGPLGLLRRQEAPYGCPQCLRLLNEGKVAAALQSGEPRIRDSPLQLFRARASHLWIIVPYHDQRRNADFLQPLAIVEKPGGIGPQSQRMQPVRSWTTAAEQIPPPHP